MTFSCILSIVIYTKYLCLPRVQIIILYEKVSGRPYKCAVDLFFFFISFIKTRKMFQLCSVKEILSCHKSDCDCYYMYLFMWTERILIFLYNFLKCFPYRDGAFHLFRATPHFLSKCHNYCFIVRVFARSCVNMFVTIVYTYIF